jgi:prolyl oligopeptidase
VRSGRHVYNFWRDANNPRGLWRRTTLDSFRAEEPVWEILLDVDALAAHEKEDWVWHGASALPGTHDRANLSLSRGGSDAAVRREFDSESKAFVRGGFCLHEAKSSTDWLDRDTLLLSSAYGNDMATKSGYARTARVWRRGSDVEKAPILMETAPESMGLWAYIDRTRETETVWFADRSGFSIQSSGSGTAAAQRSRSTT